MRRIHHAPDLIANGDPATEANGSGAYSVASFTPRERLELVRDNDDYWDPDAAQVESVTFEAIGDKQAYVNAVISEQVDLGNYQSYGNEVAGQDHLEVVQVPTGTGVQLVFNPISSHSAISKCDRRSTTRSTGRRSSKH